MTWIIIIVILVAWYLSVQKKIEPIRNNENSYIDETPKVITEEQIFERERAFDQAIDEDIDLPDAIRGRDIYIFRKLMRKWFQKLASENRYKEELIQKLRRDWLDYMYLLKQHKTNWYFALESPAPEDNFDPDKYREDAIIEGKKLLAIEEAFAAAIGKDAEKELSRIYNLDTHSFSEFSFDKFGNMAPRGSAYNLSGELVSKKSK